MKIFEWLRKMLEDGNGVPDEARVGALLMVMAFAGNSIISVVMGEHHAFDAQNFGIGAGALATGIGAWLGLRKDN